MITIGTASAKKGTTGKGVIKVAELSGYAEIFIQVLIVNGREDGPTLWINGAVHGDEINGFMATRRVAQGINPDELRGALICTPICNPLSTQWRQKLNPYDYLDMDQQYPGDPKGLYSQRVAFHLFQEIKEKADYLIDFHAVGTPYTSIPFTNYKVIPGVKPEVTQEMEKFARVFGISVNCKVNLSTATGELPGGATGGLDVNCALHGIPAYKAEIGSGGKFEEENIAVGERGILNTMKYLKMIPGEIEAPEKQIIITKRRFVYCDRAGFSIMDAKPGQILTKGQKIAHVIDLFSELETIKAEEDTLIILGRVNPIVHTGDRISFIGTEWEEINC